MSPSLWVLLALVLIFFVCVFPKRSRTKEKSVLPAAWESKRLAIRKRHNQIVGGMLLVLLIALYLLLPILGHGSPSSHRFGALLLIALVEIYGFYRLSQHDKAMCERLGFMCPHCHKPLYQPGSSITVNGRCPKCYKTIVDAIPPPTGLLVCPKCSAPLAQKNHSFHCSKCGWDRERAYERFRTVLLIYGVILVLIFIGVLWVELSSPPRFAAAMLALSVVIAIAGWQWVNRAWNALSVKQSGCLDEWEPWLRLPRPRVVRIRKETKAATIRLLTLIGVFVGFSILSALLLVELHAYSPTQLRIYLLLGLVPCFAGTLLLITSLAFSFRKSRRLVRNGEVAMANVIGFGRGPHTIIYEFRDGSGRLVSASCPDSTGLFAPGMHIPVFFNSHNPSKEQVALCSSSYEIAGSIPGAYTG
jgi:hypothetical protein